MTLAVGDCLQGGKYHVDAVLSCGRCSTTYRATHCELQQAVVLKTLTSQPPHESGAGPSTSSFMKEARCLAKLHHPHLARVSDCFVEDQQPFMVSDLIPGETLAQHLVKGPLPEADALRYIRQVGQALTCLHTQGVLHRNVKPNNIVVHAQTHRAVLVDVDVAQAPASAPTSLPPEQTADGFAAPEQSLSNEPWTAATDIYGLAATLYALCTGQDPTVATQRDRNPLLPSRQLNAKLTAALEQAILQGMALDRTERPATVEEWLALLPVPDMAANPTVAVLDHPGSSPSNPTLEQKAKRPAPQVHPASSTRYTQRYAASLPLHRSHFLIRALIWSGVIAGFGGAGAGMVLKQQFLSPTFSASPTTLPTPQSTIQESFPTKLTLPTEDPDAAPEASPETIAPVDPDPLSTAERLPENSPTSAEPSTEPLAPLESDPLEATQSTLDPREAPPVETTPDTPSSDLPSTTELSPATPPDSNLDLPPETPISDPPL